MSRLAEGTLAQWPQVRVDPVVATLLAGSRRAPAPPLSALRDEALLDGTNTRVVEYLLVLSMLGFGLTVPAGSAAPWGIQHRGIRYEGLRGLAAGLSRAVAARSDFLMGDALARLSLARFEEAFRGWAPLPLSEQRLQLMRNLGVALLDQYQGRLAHVVEESTGGARRLVELLEELPGFEDGIGEGSKRIRLGAKSVRAVRWIEGRLCYSGLGAFLDSHLLPVETTAEAVAVARGSGVLKVRKELHQRVATGVTLVGSEEDETALRLGTVAAFEALVDAHDGWPGWSGAVLLQEMRSGRVATIHRCRTTNY